jgi:anhydro-N-acetylmuramic acid kinase
MASDIIGIMSGSSLDGLDMALCRFEEIDSIVEWSIVASKTIPFPPFISEALRSAPSLSGWDLMHLDSRFGRFIGKETRAWMNALSLKADLIASHGHTVFHEPSKGFTLQIGCGANIAFESGIDTITTFRSADIAASGQGAPFAPIADKALFPGYQAYLNLGGIANVTIHTSDGNWKAWDIGPCNQALNHLAMKAGQPYDAEGKMAAGGVVVKPVVDALLSMFPYNGGQPKGLSNAEVQSSWIKYLHESDESTINLLASVTEAIALLIHDHLQLFRGVAIKILVTGGGAHNTYLINRLNALSTGDHFKYHLPSSEVINYKECLLMAWLGYLTVQGRSYGIDEVSGASRDTIGGAIYKATR